MNNSCIDQGSRERNKVSLKEHLLPLFAWNRGFVTQKSQGEYVAFFWLVVIWDYVLTAQLSTAQCVAWPAAPRLSVSGTGNFVLGKVILEILSDLREKANKVVIFPSWPLLALLQPQNCFLHRIVFSYSIYFLPLIFY